MRLETGVPIPDFELLDLEGEPAGSAALAGKKVWLILARFAACPFCALRLQDVAQAIGPIERAGVETLAIFPSADKRVRRYVEKYEPPFRVAADPEQAIFRAFGSETSWAGELKSAANVPRVFKALARARMNPLAVDDAPNRMPSEYLIDPDGTIARIHYGGELDDGFPFNEVLDWAQGRPSIG
jgi:peroxiredoxin